MEKKQTLGEALAITFKPFIDPKCKEHNEIVKDMARAIDRSFNASFKNIVTPLEIENNTPLKRRVKQLLSALDYERLTDYQAKIVLLLERDLDDKQSALNKINP